MHEAKDARMGLPAPLLRGLTEICGPRFGVQARLAPAASRFVAGASIDDAIRTVRALAQEGFAATLDRLGEDVRSHAEVERTVAAYHAAIDPLRRTGADVNFSVKLSAIGQLLSEDLAAENFGSIARAAREGGMRFVRADMEGSALTDATLRIVARVRASGEDVGPVLQAMLFRTAADLEGAIATQTRVRLCKGAYAEPRTRARSGREAIRRAYLRGVRRLLAAGRFPAFATHDDVLIRAICTEARTLGLASDRFEFQMLLGVRPELQRDLVRRGYGVRIYVPFGSHWSGYYVRRIAERPQNAIFAVRALLGA